MILSVGDQLGRTLNADIGDKPFAHAVFLLGMAIAPYVGAAGLGTLAEMIAGASLLAFIGAFVSER